MERDPGTIDRWERLAETVRETCIRAAADAYDDAGLAGLCAEGRWEAAVDAMRAVDVGRIAASQSRSARASDTAGGTLESS